MTMSCEDARLALGVYLIGAIDPAERFEVDAHLNGCAACRAELADLAMLPSVLEKLSLDDLSDLVAVAPASEDLFARVAAQARLEDELDDHREPTPLRRRSRWQLIAAAAAAVVLIGGVSITAVEVLQSSNGPNWVSSAEGSVHMRVAMSSQETGTALRVVVSGLPTDEHCRLVAVADDGSTDLVGRWKATYAGGAQVTGSTSISSAHLSKFVLYGDNGALLVTVPV